MGNIEKGGKGGFAIVWTVQINIWISIQGEKANTSGTSCEPSKANHVVAMSVWLERGEERFLVDWLGMSACGGHLQMHTDGDSIFIQASSCKGQGKENMGTTHMLPGGGMGTTYILLLGNAICLHFIFHSLSSNRQRNLIYMRTLTLKNCANDTIDIFSKSSVSLIINHLSML